MYRTWTKHEFCSVSTAVKRSLPFEQRLMFYLFLTYVFEEQAGSLSNSGCVVHEVM